MQASSTLQRCCCRTTSSPESSPWSQDGLQHFWSGRKKAVRKAVTMYNILYVDTYRHCDRARTAKRKTEDSPSTSCLESATYVQYISQCTEVAEGTLPDSTSTRYVRTVHKPTEVTDGKLPDQTVTPLSPYRSGGRYDIMPLTPCWARRFRRNERRPPATSTQCSRVILTPLSRGSHSAGGWGGG